MKNLYPRNLTTSLRPFGSVILSFVLLLFVGLSSLTWADSPAKPSRLAANVPHPLPARPAKLVAATASQQATLPLAVGPGAALPFSIF